jgi:GTPase SAR1 family protein
MKDSPLLNKEVKSKNYSSYTDKFNIIMMGEEGVGKTDILKNLSKKKYNKFKNIYIDNNYENNFNLIKQNINQDILEKISLEYNSEDKNFLIKIWNYCYISDTQLINDFMKKADAFIIVYSVKDKKSFNNIERWITEAKNKTSSKKIQFFILGNNCDEINERQVGIDEIKQFVEKDNYKFFEISSTNKEDLEESFNEIFSDVINTVYSDSDFSELEVERKNKRCCDCCKKCFIF